MKHLTEKPLDILKDAKLHLTTLMDSGVCVGRRGLDNTGECCNHNVTHVKPS